VAARRRLGTTQLENPPPKIISKNWTARRDLWHHWAEVAKHTRRTMTRLLPLLLLALGGLMGCARHALPKSNCEWPQEASPDALNLSQPSQQRHLSADAEFAEDIAIRYADARSGPHSGHFQGMPEYGRTRDECMATLFTVIASSHGVTEEQVRSSLGRRPIGIDLAVMLSFALLFGFCASLISRRIVQRYPIDDGWIGPAVMTMLTAVAVSAGGVLAGEQWSVMLEGVRLSSGHLSYRMERIPWTQHRLSLFLGGVILVGIISGVQYYLDERYCDGQPRAPRTAAR
jgi:hypothetical protein